MTSEGRGQGAAFCISLPVVAMEHAAVTGADRQSATAETRPAPVQLDGLRILVVDDDQDARELITELLRSRGADVRTAASAHEARSLLDTEPPDVLLSDIAMPGHDGLELIRSVRERPLTAGGRVPAIALTAYARDEDRARSLAAGFDAHLAKPVDVDALVMTVAGLGRAKDAEA